jgi:small nuclear ribonucleoprotein
MIKPLSLLNQKINSNVLVELKGGRGYRGVLDGFDPHMNLVLRNAEETQDSESQRKLDLAIVRGDNVIYISP